LEFQFLRSRVILTNPFGTLSLGFWVIGKTTCLISSPAIILLNKFLSASACAVMSWQDVIRACLFSGVKECGKKRAHNFLFPKFTFRILRSGALGIFKYSAISLDAILRSFLTKVLATAATFSMCYS
jgi:hypothetical protein